MTISARNHTPTLQMALSPVDSANASLWTGECVVDPFAGWPFVNPVGYVGVRSNSPPPLVARKHADVLPPRKRVYCLLPTTTYTLPSNPSFTSY